MEKVCDLWVSEEFKIKKIASSKKVRTVILFAFLDKFNKFF